MANKYNIVDGFTPSMLTDITRKIQTKFEVSSQKFLLALENKNQLLTNMEVILKIAMGCTRYMDVGLGLDVKSVIQSAKKSLQQPTKKSLEVSAINQKLVDLNYGENPFRPWHVHNPLFEAGVNIRKETLSKVLKYHIAMNILSKSKQLPRKKHCERTEKISGPNSYYESSSFLKEIRRVLGVPEGSTSNYCIVIGVWYSHKICIFYYALACICQRNKRTGNMEGRHDDCNHHRCGFSRGTDIRPP